MTLRRSLAVLLLAMLLLAAAVYPRRAQEGFITRKSHLYEAGVTLQGPHVRALNTGGR